MDSKENITLLFVEDVIEEGRKNER